jgi:hypothetical protein
MSTFDPSLDPQKREAALTEREIAVRDFFVNEYVKDFDPFRACIRMGFLAAFAVDQAKTFMQDGYVLRKIAYLTTKAPVAGDSDKAEMLANLRWLAHNGPPAVRASATKIYMEAQGYLKGDGTAEEEMIAKLSEVLSDFGKNAPA